MEQVKDKNLGVVYTDNIRFARILLGEMWKRDEYRICDVNQPMDIVFDFGANQGFFTKIFNHRKGDVNTSYYCYEPIPGNFELLKLNTVDIPNVNLFPYGVSEFEGEFPVYVSRFGDIASGMYTVGLPAPNRKISSSNAKLRALKDVLLDFNLVGRRYFLKCDIEGAEDVFFFTDYGLEFIKGSYMAAFEAHFYKGKPKWKDYLEQLNKFFPGKYLITHVAGEVMGFVIYG